METVIAPILSLALPIGLIIKTTNWEKVWKNIKKPFVARLHPNDDSYEPIYQPSV